MELAAAAFDFLGHRVVYYAAGRGRPLLFLHNGGNDHRIWQHQLAHFAPSCRVYAIDLLGFGESDRPEIDYDLDLYTELVGEFADQLGLESATLVGNCVGSATALAYALRRPERVDSLILCNLLTRASLTSGGLGLLARASQQSLLRRGLARLARGLVPPPRLRRLSIRLQYGRRPLPGEAEFIDQLVELHGRPGQLRALYSLLENLDSFAMLDQLEGVELPPIALIWGDENRVLPASGGRRLADQLQPVRVWFAEGKGHLVMREAPDEVNEIIEEMRAQPAAATPS